MKLYDETIRKVRALLSSEKQQLPHDATAWPSVSDRSMLLRSDMAYELGGGSLPALGVTLVTASKDLVPGDGVFLTGPDLPEIDADTPFARIALVRVGEDTLGEGKSSTGLSGILSIPATIFTRRASCCGYPPPNGGRASVLAKKP